MECSFRRRDRTGNNFAGTLQGIGALLACRPRSLGDTFARVLLAPGATAVALLAAAAEPSSARRVAPSAPPPTVAETATAYSIAPTATDASRDRPRHLPQRRVRKELGAFLLALGTRNRNLSPSMPVCVAVRM